MLESLQKKFGLRLKLNEPLAIHTHFRIGGPAKRYIEVQTADEITFALNAAAEAGVRVLKLGGGSNVLVSDAGFDGLVLKLANRSMRLEGTRSICDAGVLSAFAARKTAEAGLAGLAWAISLPGTIGGAVRGNAGCFGGEIKDTLETVDVWRSGSVCTLSKFELAFGYRESAIKHTDDVVLSATFALQAGDREMLLKQIDDTLTARKSRQPLYAGSAGCLFKNVEWKEETEIQKLRAELDVPPLMLASRRISAGWIVDQLGLKGTRIGDAQISQEHGNFIVNLGKATADEVMQLMALVKTRARNALGIQLHEEVEYVG